MNEQKFNKLLEECTSEFCDSERDCKVEITKPETQFRRITVTTIQNTAWCYVLEKINRIMKKTNTFVYAEVTDDKKIKFCFH